MPAVTGHSGERKASKKAPSSLSSAAMAERREDFIGRKLLLRARVD